MGHSGTKALRAFHCESYLGGLNILYIEGHMEQNGHRSELV